MGHAGVRALTATLPQRGPSITVGGPTAARPVSLLREYRLYRFFDDAGRLLYVGITGRQTLERLLEHVRSKGWAPDMACWERDPRIWHTEAEVLAVEKATIVTERPVHNVAHNGNNPGRPAARQQSVRADPTATPRRTASGPSLWSRFWSTRFGRWLLAKLTYAGKVAAAWAALALTAWIAVAVLAVKVGSPMPWQDSAGAGGFLACAAVGAWAVRRSNRKTRQTRRASNRRRPRT